MTIETKTPNPLVCKEDIITYAVEDSSSNDDDTSASFPDDEFLFESPIFRREKLGSSLANKIRPFTWSPGVFSSSEEDTDSVYSVVSENIDYSTSTSSFFGGISLGSISPCISPCKRRASKKRVRFSCARVREYGLTVGSHTGASDSCPLQLTWEHTEEKIELLHDPNDEIPKWGDEGSLLKLNIKERRARIATAQGISIDDVRELELKILMQQIDTAMEEAKIAGEKLQAFHEEERRGSQKMSLPPRRPSISIPSAA